MIQFPGKLCSFSLLRFLVLLLFPLSSVPQTVSPLAETIEGNKVTDKPQEEVMTIADAAILAAHKACDDD